MIDEKKIEVPKKLYIKDYQLKQCAIDGIADARLNTNSFRTNEGKLVEYLCLDTLWHDASEEPKVGKEYLLKAAFFNDEGENFDDYVTSTFGVDGWKEDFLPRGYNFEVEEWVCIDDLLKSNK